MINFRYHVASLIAVFLALGIGMLIGNSFVGLASVEAQTPLLRGLQGQVAEVRQQVHVTQLENASLKQRLIDRDRALRAVAPPVIAGTLSGRRIALVLVEEPERPEIVTDLIHLLTAAGSHPPTVTRINRNWLPETGAARREILDRLKVAEGEEPFMKATRALARALVSGNWSGALNAVAQQTTGIEIDGDYTQPVGSVILITAATDSQEALSAQSEKSVERLMVNAWKRGGLRVVAAEPENAPASLVSYFRNLEVMTIDNIDTAMGQLACVLALSAGQGHYGTKETADRLLPELPQADTTSAFPFEASP